jgi:hypothetical protein
MRRLAVFADAARRRIHLPMHLAGDSRRSTTMIALRRGFLTLLTVAGLIGSSGCCCCSPCNTCGNGCGCGLLCGRELPDDYRGAGSYWCDCGCGELYCGDWHSYPPECCDPCDCCGNYIGPHHHGPGYQLPPRVGTAGPAPSPPTEMSAPTVAPPRPTPPMSPSSARKRRSSGAVQASYDAPQPKHCATCGN